MDNMIVNVYKPSPTRLQMSDIPMFFQPCLYAGAFNCPHTDWGYNFNSVYNDFLASLAGIKNLILLYNLKNPASFYSGHWNTETNPELAFVSVGSDNMTMKLSGFVCI